MVILDALENGSIRLYKVCRKFKKENEVIEVVEHEVVFCFGKFKLPSKNLNVFENYAG